MIWDWTKCSDEGCQWYHSAENGWVYRIEEIIYPRKVPAVRYVATVEYQNKRKSFVKSGTYPMSLDGAMHECVTHYYSCDVVIEHRIGEVHE